MNMTMEQFILMLDETFADFEDNYRPDTFFVDRAYFRSISGKRWGLCELEKCVEDEIPNSDDAFPVYMFIDAVVSFKYQMAEFAVINLEKRAMFDAARDVADEVEEILNAMM